MKILICGFFSLDNVNLCTIEKSPSGCTQVPKKKYTASFHTILLEALNHQTITDFSTKYEPNDLRHFEMAPIEGQPFGPYPYRSTIGLSFEVGFGFTAPLSGQGTP